MIDTIILESPEISEETADIISDVSVSRFGIDFEKNQILYRFTNKNLKGTYDSSIRISIKRDKWINVYCPNNKKYITEKQECNPYLEIECSLHKFFLGHNIFGGSDNVKYQVKKLVEFINDEFSIKLPDYNNFVIKRLDYAKVYNLGSNIDSFFQGFNNVYYPRRKCIKYDNTGLYFPGTYTTLKLYNKYEEFKKHDKKKLRKVLQPKKLYQLEQKAKGLLRIELEVKARKLRHIYNKLPKLSEINISDIENQFNQELKRIFKVGSDKMKIYNNTKEVEKVIKENFSSQKANILLGTWYRLSIFGYDHVKNEMPKSTFYRHINDLKSVGVTWNHTDIQIKDNKVIKFVFNPLNTDLEIADDLISNVS